MKKVILLFAMCLVTIGLSAQIQMNTTVNLKPEVSYYVYTGNASDTIKRVADSAYVEVINGFDHEYKLNVISSIGKVTNADTTVQITIWGKNSASESYSQIIGATTANITSAAVITSTAYTTALRYRYIKISYRLRATPKSAGVKINKIELKLWKP